jgi:hypothetical protein
LQTNKSLDYHCDPNDNPNASTDTHKSGALFVDSKYDTKEKESSMLPITIKKDDDSNNYVILENHLFVNDVMDYTTSDRMVTNMPIPKPVPPKKEKMIDPDYKMNVATRFYIGSLTVVGLFVFYRLIQKTR